MPAWVSVRTGVFAAAGVLAGLLAWLAGPRLALAVATGLGLAGALVVLDWLRARQRWLGTELIQLRRTVVSSTELAAAEKRLHATGAKNLAAMENRLLKRGSRDLAARDKQFAAVRRQDFAQAQAMQNLYAMLPVQRRMPPARSGWSVSPDLLLLLVSLVQEHRPTAIVDLGSGVSTVWMALALRELGIDGRVIAVDHELEYAEATSQWLAALALDKVAEVRHAPLVDLELDGEVYPWYDRDALADVGSCGLLFVDGPPGKLRSESRYPALALMDPVMVPGSMVVVDDYGRPDERHVVSRWLSRLPGWTLREFPFEKGAALLTRTTGRP